MDKTLLAAALALACASVPAAAQFEQFKGKMKPGLYDYKMTMEMPGMPSNMGKQAMNMQHCLKDEDINGGKFNSKGQMPKDCKVENFKMAGNTASYTMSCTGTMNMSAENRIAFSGDGFVMDSKSTMNHGGTVMNSTSHMEAKYVGPCK